MTVSDTKASAPPLGDEEVPVVVATAIPTTADVVTTSVTASIPNANSKPQPAEVPGMSMVTKTMKYPDGREVTTTEYVPNDSAPAATTLPFNVDLDLGRRDLGSRPVSITCPSCQHTGLTKTHEQFGPCTWVSVIFLCFFCFPLFWVPFVCPSCNDVEHFCTNCGKRVGWNQAECCRN